VDLALDGDWNNPTDINDPLSDTFPSGDASPGVDFVFHYNVAPPAPLVSLDVDGDGQAGALTGGILIVRYLFGLTGYDLVAGNVVSADAHRTDPAEIAYFLAGFMPSVNLALNQ